MDTSIGKDHALPLHGHIQAGRDMKDNSVILGNNNTQIIQNFSYGQSSSTAFIDSDWELLPAPEDNFEGREKDIDDVCRLISQTPVVCIFGMPGLGKTQLALKVAQKIKSYFPRQIRLKLMGEQATPPSPEELLKRFFSRLQVMIPQDDTLEALHGLYAQTLRGRRALIILDDAANQQQIKAFQPPEGCALLVTARQWLIPHGMKSSPFKIEELTLSETLRFLQKLLPTLSQETAQTIYSYCGGLPLVLQAVGNYLQSHQDVTPEEYCQNLREEQTRLQILDQHTIDNLKVGAALNLSYQRLASETQKVFHQLVVFPESFEAEAEIKICEDPNHRQLSELVAMNLVSFEASGRRYRIHGLVRLFIRHQVFIEAEELEYASQRHAQYYGALLEKISQQIMEGTGDLAISWDQFDREIQNIETAYQWVSVQSERHIEAAEQCCAWVLQSVYILQNRFDAPKCQKWLLSVVKAAQYLGKPEIEGLAKAILSNSYLVIGKTEAAVEYAQQAVQLLEGGQDKTLVSQGWAVLGSVELTLGHLEQAKTHLKKSLDLFGLNENDFFKSFVLIDYGRALLLNDDAEGAVAAFEESLHLSLKNRNELSEGITRCNIGALLFQADELETALEHLQRSLSIAQNYKNTQLIVAVQKNLGGVYLNQGDIGRAISAYEQALEYARKIENPLEVIQSLHNLGDTLLVDQTLDRAQTLYQSVLQVPFSFPSDLEQISRFKITLVEELRTIPDAPFSLPTNLTEEFPEALPLLEFWLIGQAVSLFRYRQPKTALYFLKKAAFILEHNPDQREQEVILGMFGNLCLENQEITSSIEYHQKALELSRKIENKSDESVDLFNLGNVYEQLGDTQTTLSYFKAALELSKELENWNLEKTIHYRLGSLYRRNNQWNFARASFETLIERASSKQDREAEKKGFGALVEINAPPVSPAPLSVPPPVPPPVSVPPPVLVPPVPPAPPPGNGGRDMKALRQLKELYDTEEKQTEPPTVERLQCLVAGLEACLGELLQCETDPLALPAPEAQVREFLERCRISSLAVDVGWPPQIQSIWKKFAGSWATQETIEQFEHQIKELLAPLEQDEASFKEQQTIVILLEERCKTLELLADLLDELTTT